VVGPLSFVQHNLDKIPFSFQAGDQEMVQGIQPAGSALDFSSQAVEAQLALRQLEMAPLSQMPEKSHQCDRSADNRITSPAEAMPVLFDEAPTYHATDVYLEAARQEARPPNEGLVRNAWLWPMPPGVGGCML
jgi:hypothetical protein